MHVESTRTYRGREVAERSDGSTATNLGIGTGTLRVTGVATLAYAEICTQAANDSLMTTSTMADR